MQSLHHQRGRVRAVVGAQLGGIDIGNANHIAPIADGQAIVPLVVSAITLILAFLSIFERNLTLSLWLRPAA